MQVRPKLLWSLGYNGGVSTTTGAVYSTYSNLNQAVNAHIIWAFANRWQFRFKDSYFYSDDPFQPFFTFLSAPTPNNPNPVIYFPQTVLEQNQATADITYLLGPHDSVDFYGGESFQHYLRGIATSNNSGFNPGALWNSTTYSGGVFYQHVFSPRLSGGEGYIFTAMDFGHGQSRAGVQTFQTYVTYRISPRMTRFRMGRPGADRHERYCPADLLSQRLPDRSNAHDVLERRRGRHLQLGGPARQFLRSAVQPQHHQRRRLVWCGALLPGGGDVIAVR